MSAGLTHHAACTLELAANRLGELGAALDRDAPSMDFVRIRLDDIRRTLLRDAREYEQMAASEYVDGSAKLTDRQTEPDFYPCESVSIRGSNPPS